MRVKAYYRGGKKLYSGRISKSNTDGTFNITYDDGDKEVHVQKDLIKAVAHNGDSDEFDPDPTSSSERFPNGARVEARFRGKAKWYPGKVVRCDGDGLYTVKYDDGDVESGIEAELVRSAEKSSKTIALIDRIIESGIKHGDLDGYREAFEMFDTNANGKISASEFGRAMKSMGIRVSVW